MRMCTGIQRRGIKLKAVAPGGDAARNERASLAHMRSEVMPTQEKFDPIIYLGTVHWVCLGCTPACPYDLSLPLLLKCVLGDIRRSDMHEDCFKCSSNNRRVLNCAFLGL